MTKAQLAYSRSELVFSSLLPVSSNNSNAESFSYDKGEDNSTDDYVTMYMRNAIIISWLII